MVFNKDSGTFSDQMPGRSADCPDVGVREGMAAGRMEPVNEELRDTNGRMEEWDFILVNVSGVKGATRIRAGSVRCNHDRPGLGDLRRVKWEGEWVVIRVGQCAGGDGGKRVC